MLATWFIRFNRPSATKTFDQAQLEKTLSVYQRSKSRGASLEAIIDDAAPTAAVKTKVRQILEAEKQITSGVLPSILINGETGTGKELLARALHFDGTRKDKPFKSFARDLIYASFSKEAP